MNSKASILASQLHRIRRKLYGLIKHMETE